MRTGRDLFKCFMNVLFCQRRTKQMMLRAGRVIAWDDSRASQREERGKGHRELTEARK